jgi:hypothetical protein
VLILCVWRWGVLRCRPLTWVMKYVRVFSSEFYCYDTLPDVFPVAIPKRTQVIRQLTNSWNRKSERLPKPTKMEASNHNGSTVVVASHAWRCRFQPYCETGAKIKSSRPLDNVPLPASAFWRIFVRHWDRWRMRTGMCRWRLPSRRPQDVALFMQTSQI